MVHSIGFAQDSELKVIGFADIILTFMDEGKDGAEIDVDGNPANSTEGKTSVDAEVDFEYSEGGFTLRLDLDIPANGNEARGVAGSPGNAGIEQANFVWALPGGQDKGLTLTGGAFNAPIGFELQDAPDKLQTTNGQLFNLVPSNLAGFMISGGIDTLSLDLYYVNEWIANQAQDNSFGGLLSLNPIPVVGIALGYISSPEKVGDEDVLDLVLSGTMSLKTDIEILGPLELLKDGNNHAWAIVFNGTHNSPKYPHGLTLRYDSVDCGATTASCKDPATGLPVEATPTSLTLAVFASLTENLKALLEWRTNDSDVSGVDPTDRLTWEFVAMF